MKQIYEDLLNFVWQYSRLPLNITTTSGQRVEILHPGNKNTDSGPDFLGAKLKIDDTVWGGNVEIHVKTSDWFRHGHQNNPDYNSVILHVVYEHDKIDEQNKILNIPTLELSPYINKNLIDKYYELMLSQNWIPCQNNLKSVAQIIVNPWLTRITVERLESKTQAIREILASTIMNWDTSFFWWLSSCFGFKLNNNAFLLLARSIPLSVLMRHHDNIFQIEAMLLGQAGLLLNMYNDDYAKALKKEYDFLSIKYNIKPIDPKLWKFMRTRPGNFPTVRISQLANILSRLSLLLAEMFGNADIDNIRTLLKSQASEYWESHYHFDKKSASAKPKHLGHLATDNIIINAIVPFIFLYGEFHASQKFKDTAINLLMQIQPEDNHILKKWKSLNITAENAAESQALIELYNSYCSKKKCLMCSIGASLLLDVST